MQLRQKLVKLVETGYSVSRACRELGVSRPTGYLWLERAKESGVASMQEHSRRPHHVPRHTLASVEQELLGYKLLRPTWGAKKLLAKYWPQGPPISLRTADRILKRHGLAGERPESKEMIRFEREQPNELWQMDFKGVGSRRYEAFSVVDDCSRFCLHFAPLTDLRTKTTFRALWEVFGEFGLPDRILSDNSPPFGCAGAQGPTKLEAMLWLLGIKTSHGQPYHPQTQGKVERFHLTVEQDIGPILKLAKLQDLEIAMSLFRNDYNWERPHEALQMKVPGLVYRASLKARPSKLPAHEIPEGAIARKVDAAAKIVYKNREYKIGKGLIGQYVEIREEEGGLAAYFANTLVRTLKRNEL